MKLAILFDNFGPYHRARLAAAAKEVDLFAIECFGRSDDYQWGAAPTADFEGTTLFPKRGRSGVSVAEMHRRLGEALLRCSPEAVAIPGWSSSAAFCALLWCLRHGVPAVAMCDSTEWDKHRLWIKEAVKRRLARLFSAALVAGTSHHSYAISLGFPRERIFTGYDTVDNAFFARGAEECRRLGPPPGLPGQPYFLASCRFVAEKNLVRLLQAYGRYRERATEKAWDLIILGDGPLKPEILSARHHLGLDQSVHLPGFIQHEDLPVYFAHAAAFVHASMVEPWGLVVNEAMASGLPVIVSERCGCAADLVSDGINGFLFDPASTDDLTALLLRMASNACDRVAMGAASRVIISRWTIENFAVNLRRAAEMAVGHPPARLKMSDSALLSYLAYQ